MRLLRLVFALAAFAALGTVSAPMASAGPAAGADRALQREASRLLRTPNGPPGIAITVQRGKRRTFLNGGRAIAGTRRRIRSTDHMRLASTSKAFSGAVALLLVERGQLRLNDTIGQRVPSLPLAWRNVTLRQLLNHTSGVPNYTEA
ncbi:MAG: beta-lactamase family protein, partial [Thermoleophilaceae bacterium]|nr:beta-lactamase family protein [Thermoleophilaceae bacterium]